MAEPTGANSWLHWGLPCTVLLVIGLGMWSWRAQPRSTLVCRTWATTSATLAAPTPKPSHAWRLHLSLDPDVKPPGPGWMLYEGRQPGEGYELHWLPQRLAFQLFRTGEQQLLLGTTGPLERSPLEVTCVRRGLRLLVIADGTTVLECLDLTRAPAQSTWGFRAAAAMGDVMLSLHDDTRLLREGERQLLSEDVGVLARVASDTGRADHALARVRHCTSLPADRNGDAEAAHASAELAVSALALSPYQGDYLRLRSWLAWNGLRLALLRSDRESTARASLAVAELTGLAARPQQCQELPGLLLQALPPLVQRACQRPQQPTPPEEVLEHRRTWMAMLAEVGYSAMDVCDSNVSESVHWQLRLLVQGADCLLGRSPQPTPAEGPSWLTSRWRAFAARNPLVGKFPPLPGGTGERNPVQPALEELIAHARFDPLPALAMRERILAAVERRDRAEALAAVDDPDAPRREAVLSRAMLALRGYGDADTARKALAAPEGEQKVPLTTHDPLAFALDRLLQARLDRRGIPGGSQPAAPGGPRQPSIPGVVVTPESLGPFERLLSGKPTSVNEVWLHDVAVLPPSQALATALAMMEVAGDSPNWALLTQFQSFTLPLPLMVPVTSPDPSVQDPAPTKPPVPAAPPVVP